MIDLVIFQLVVERQPDDGLEIAPGVGQLPAVVFVFVIGAGVERDVMEHGVDVFPGEVFQQPVAFFEAGGGDVKDMPVDGGVIGQPRQADLPLSGQRLEFLIIPVPDLPPPLLDLFELPQLCIQDGGDDLRRQKGGADIDPLVLTDLSPLERHPVGSLLPYDLGPPDEAFVIDRQASALSRHDVLGLMVRESAEMTDTAQRFAAMERVDGVGGVFDHKEVMAPGQLHDAVHVAGYARVMHQRDRPRARGDQLLQLFRIDVGVQRAAVGKDDPGAPQHKSIGRRDKGKGGDDHLVAGADTRQDSGHLQSIGAGGGQQRLPETVGFLQQPLALAGVKPVAGYLPRPGRLDHRIDLVSGQIGPVERDVHSIGEIIC